MSMICKDVMTTDPVCCVPEETVNLAARLMKAEDVGSIPIVEDPESRKLIGIVTDRDLAVEVVAEGRDSKNTRIGEVMKRALFTCRDTDRVEEALDSMALHQVRRIPVVDQQGCIIGIIAQGDLATRLDEPEKTGEVVALISR